jgi:hypothetical protein
MSRRPGIAAYLERACPQSDLLEWSNSSRSDLPWLCRSVGRTSGSSAEGSRRICERLSNQLRLGDGGNGHRSPHRKKGLAAIPRDGILGWRKRGIGFRMFVSRSCPKPVLDRTMVCGQRCVVEQRIRKAFGIGGRSPESPATRALRCIPAGVHARAKASPTDAENEPNSLGAYPIRAAGQNVAKVA